MTLAQIPEFGFFVQNSRIGVKILSGTFRILRIFLTFDFKGPSWSVNGLFAFKVSLKLLLKTHFASRYDGSTRKISDRTRTANFGPICRWIPVFNRPLFDEKNTFVVIFINFHNRNFDTTNPGFIKWFLHIQWLSINNWGNKKFFYRAVPRI